jgi:DNA-binding winged helix-turn-helix (wHTH) protein
MPVVPPARSILWNGCDDEVASNFQAFGKRTMKVAFGRFVFDSATRELLRDGERQHVSPKAFDVLQLLLERRPGVVSKTELHDRVWAGSFVGDANLTVVVAEIRQALGDDSKDARFIRTVHRVGYAFCGAATALDPDGQPRDRAAGAPRCWLSWNDQALPLAAGENIVGRDPGSDVWVDGSGVSRRHARVFVAPGEVTIEDLGSRNGTFVKGRGVTGPVGLEDGDEIELGSAVLTFRKWSEDRAAKTERIARRRR